MKRKQSSGWLPYVLLGVLGSLFFPRSLFAQVTFNTALPLTQGEGIFRIQTKLARATKDSSPMDRKMETWMVPSTLVWGTTERTALFFTVPYLDKSITATLPNGTRRTRKVSGFGDITLLGRYTIYQKDERGSTFRIAPFIGLKLPTGNDNERDRWGRFPQPFQLGSGSWDPLAGSAFVWQTLDGEMDADVSYKANTEANNFEFGDEFHLDFAYRFRLLPRRLEYQSGVPGFLYAGLETNWIWQGQNTLRGTKDPDSGGITAYVSPALQYVTRRIVWEAAWQRPVVQNLRGNALKTDWVGTLSLRINF